MKKTHSLFGFLLFVLLTHSLAAPSQTLNLQSGSKLFFQSSIQNPDQPTLILMPGIYRGYLPGDKILELLTQKKVNWIAIHFSRHPESVLAGSRYLTGMVTSQELVSEILQLKKAMRIKKPVLVSLSFSASLSPYVNPADFPVIIETAPMGRHDESRPPDAFYQAWQKWMDLFPIWGPWLVQSSDFWSYRGFWLQKVSELTATHPRYETQKIQIAEGLAQLAWSSRGFDIRNQDFKIGPERFWILGQKEDSNRLQLQLAAVQLHKQTGVRSSRLVVIPNAGHIIPSEQPELYTEALKKIIKKIRFQ